MEAFKQWPFPPTVDIQSPKVALLTEIFTVQSSGKGRK